MSAKRRFSATIRSPREKRTVVVWATDKRRAEEQLREAAKYWETISDVKEMRP